GPMGRVIVLGSLITDLVARAPRLPRPGETVLGEGFATFLGGKGFNQAVAAARQGASVILLGQVGADDYGDAFFPALAEEGIDATFVSRDTTTGTGISCVLVGRESGENMIVANPRANFTLTVAQVDAAMSALREEGDTGSAGQIAPQAVFLAQCETPMETVRAGLALARQSGMLTLLNVAPVPREPLHGTLFDLVDILIVNETEATALSGTPVADEASARVAAEQVIERGCRQVVITLGAHGYLWSSAELGGSVRHHSEPAFAVAAVDATAAGDAFCGALAASLAAGDAIEDALRRANASGAIAVTRAGALPSLPARGEVDALLATPR
ncbi:MAG TPA: ribokinase, partial [Ktedonobacterales bacterium]